MKLGCEKFLQRFPVDGWGVEITLAEFAAELFEMGLLAGCFDAFGNHFEVKMMGQGHDQAGDFTAFHVLLDPANERAIDLQNVDGKASDAAERRMAGAKIIDAEANPEVL